MSDPKPDPKPEPAGEEKRSDYKKDADEFWQSFVENVRKGGAEHQAELDRLEEERQARMEAEIRKMAAEGRLPPRSKPAPAKKDGG